MTNARRGHGSRCGISGCAVAAPHLALSACGNDTQTVAVASPGSATSVVDNLTPGTSCCSVSAVESDGSQSPLASEVSATVN